MQQRQAGTSCSTAADCSSANKASSMAPQRCSTASSRPRPRSRASGGRPRSRNAPGSTPPLQQCRGPEAREWFGGGLRQLDDRDGTCPAGSPIELPASLERARWPHAAGVARAHGSAPHRFPYLAPPRAAAHVPEEDESDPKRRRGQHKHRHHDNHRDSHGHGKEKPRTDHGGPRQRVGSPSSTRRGHPAVGREVGEQLRKVAVGSCTQRSAYAPLELVRLQPTLAGRLAQSVHDRVAIGIRCPQRVLASHRSPGTVPRREGMPETLTPRGAS
jgi:hypothetical protein